jgi:hypothetical protein
MPGYNDAITITAIEFRFWPPAGLDGADAWSCRCGDDEEAPDGHWHFQVPVQPPPPPPATSPQWARQPNPPRGF